MKEAHILYKKSNLKTYQINTYSVNIILWVGKNKLLIKT